MEAEYKKLLEQQKWFLEIMNCLSEPWLMGLKDCFDLIENIH
jgi:hypothetical protein